MSDDNDERIETATRPAKGKRTRRTGGYIVQQADVTIGDVWHDLGDPFPTTTKAVAALREQLAGKTYRIARVTFGPVKLTKAVKETVKMEPA